MSFAMCNAVCIQWWHTAHFDFCLDLQIAECVFLRILYISLDIDSSLFQFLSKILGIGFLCICNWARGNIVRRCYAFKMFIYSYLWVAGNETRVAKLNILKRLKRMISQKYNLDFCHVTFPSSSFSFQVTHSCIEHSIWTRHCK